MKKAFSLLIACMFFLSLFAQESNSPGQKFDTVYMKNGETKIGSVTNMTDASISFVHKGETLTYTLKKPDVVKIVFSSGRVKNINNPAAANTVITASTADHHNKAAVLPFAYINNQQSGDVEVGYKIQDECYNILSNKAAALTFQDPVTTNALLGKAGVTFENARSFTMTEICNILGVEYVVKGTVTSNVTNVSTSGNAGYNSTSGSSSTKDNSKKSSGSVYTSSTTQENFKTSVLMETYMDDGKKVFGQDRTSFWNTIDAYKSTLQYLLKKAPIYGK